MYYHIKMKRVIGLIIVISLLSANGYAQTESSDTLRFDDGSWYVGGIVDSLFNGTGTMKYSDGTLYNGEWKDGLWDGKGTLRFPDGDYYSGSFKEHKMDGEGVYKYANGAEYNGAWKNNMFNGVGTLIYEDGGYYAGEWKDDMRHGTGVLFSKQDTTVYKGYFDNDIYVGEGVGEYEEDIVSNQTDYTYEEYYTEPESAYFIDFAIGGNDMFIVDFSIGNGYTFWGATLSTNIGKRTFGLTAEPYREGEEITAIGWGEYPDEEYIEGDFNAYNILFHFGWYMDSYFQFGMNIGIGANHQYINCIDSDSNIFDEKQLYYKTRFKNVFFNYGAFVRFNIGYTDNLNYNMTIGLNKAEGLYAGVGIQF